VLVAGCWSLSVVAGAALLAVGPTAPRPEPAELSPYSLAAYLTRVAGPDAQQVRVNGVYGSGHSGAWQFTAHLSWRDADGAVQGGTTELPGLAGNPALQSDFDSERLQVEQEIGWSMSDLDRALDRLSGVNDRLAMLELEIRGDGSGDVIACRSAGTEQAGTCRSVDRNARTGERFAARLTDEPLANALSVRRS
jgi:hypothetical protein